MRLFSPSVCPKHGILSYNISGQELFQALVHSVEQLPVLPVRAAAPAAGPDWEFWPLSTAALSTASSMAVQDFCNAWPCTARAGTFQGRRWLWGDGYWWNGTGELLPVPEPVFDLIPWKYKGVGQFLHLLSSWFWAKQLLYFQSIGFQ